MKMMEETLKANFNNDNELEAEAFELQNNSNRKRKLKYDPKMTGGDSLDDIDLNNWLDWIYCKAFLLNIKFNLFTSLY